jgi:hypothetical protein
LGYIFSSLLGLPSFISDWGLWPTSREPRNAVSKRRCASSFENSSLGARDMASSDEKSQVDISDPETDKIDEEYRDLCTNIGIALVTWQDVEKSHYRLFRKFLGVEASAISSVVYFSAESFESRRKMVSRMASYYLAGAEYAEQRQAWQTLEKELKDANDNRNKIAHYSAEYPLIKAAELPNGVIEFEFGPVRLQPSPENYVSKALGRTPDKEEHNLSSREIRRYTAEFLALSGRLDQFTIGIADQNTRRARGQAQARAPNLGSQ